LTAPLPGRAPEGSCEALLPREGRLTPEGRVLGEDGTRPPEGLDAAPVEGRDIEPVDGREMLPLEGREALPVEGRE
jgi:hypothetical protein